jgi:1A family penicillin-binding protein
LAVAAAVSVLLFVALFTLAYATMTLPDRPPSVQTSLILDSKGKTLSELYKDQNRVDVSLDKVSKSMQKAVIAAEDRHFYSHSGIDPVGMSRAFLHDLRGGGLQGGSTITQQLVKNTYLTPQRTIVRKFKEAVLAVKVEQQYSKHDILEQYLNTVYFGRGAYGIEKAAQVYFKRSAADLDVPQSALLAGLIRAPERADPTTAAAEAIRRRNSVLDAMVRTKAITRAVADAAIATPLGTQPRSDPNQTLQGSTAYFVAMVRHWAVEKFGERVAFGGGLHIETTLDSDVQAAADDAVRAVLNKPDDPDAAVVSMTNDGAVLAMIGGKDFQTSQVNLATNSVRPQAGSTFKPFVLAAALNHDIPVTQTFAGPKELTVDFDGFPPYKVQNFGNESFGQIDLTAATAHSVNTYFAQLAAKVSLPDIAETAHDLGIETKFRVVPSMALGSANVSPYEMLRAYMTFANRGERITPYFVQRVTDADGHELYHAQTRRQRVYPEDYADVVNEILTHVVTEGTGRAAAIGRPVAGKTGTTNDNLSAWFIGYTPKVGTAVWMGYGADYKRPMDNVHGRQVTGGSFPAQIWQRFMKALVVNRDTGKFTEPNPDLLHPAKSDEETTTSTESTTSSSSSTVLESSTTSTTNGNGNTTTTSTTSTTAATTTSSSSTTSTTQRKGAA